MYGGGGGGRGWLYFGSCPSHGSSSVTMIDEAAFVVTVGRMHVEDTDS